MSGEGEGERGRVGRRELADEAVRNTRGVAQTPQRLHRPNPVQFTPRSIKSIRVLFARRKLAGSPKDLSGLHFRASRGSPFSPRLRVASGLLARDLGMRSAQPGNLSLHSAPHLQLSKLPPPP